MSTENATDTALVASATLATSTPIESVTHDVTTEPVVVAASTVVEPAADAADAVDAEDADMDETSSTTGMDESNVFVAPTVSTDWFTLLFVGVLITCVVYLIYLLMKPYIR
jgi:preprotein translocase subunit SecF